MKNIFFILISLHLISCGSNQAIETVEAPEVKLVDKYKLMKSDELVIDAFKDADIVLLGENHWLKQHVDFVVDIIPKLHENGVHILYSEFISVDYSPLVDSLINGETFDEDLARVLLMRNLWDWPYQEYMEIYRSAWKLNKTISDGPKFRIIGLDRPYNFEVMQTPEDWNDMAKRKAFFVDWEDSWADRVLAETVEKGQKAAIYCGLNHAITFYHQPFIEDGKFVGRQRMERVGHFIYDKIGDRAKFMAFHIPWSPIDGTWEPQLAPMKGRFDQLVDSLPDEMKAYGFYTKQSSLGDIIDSSGYYAAGIKDFTLKDLCDGYLVTTPLCDIQICTFIDNFIDSSLIDLARPQVMAFEHIPNISIERANDTLQLRYQRLIQELETNKENMGCYD